MKDPLQVFVFASGRSPRRTSPLRTPYYVLHDSSVLVHLNNELHFPQSQILRTSRLRGLARYYPIPGA